MQHKKSNESNANMMQIKQPTIKRQHYNINCLNVSVNTYFIRSKTQSDTVKNINFSK